MDSLIQRRKLIKSKSTRINTFLESARNSDVETLIVTDIEVRLEKLEECWKDFSDVQDQIELQCSDDQLFTQEAERVHFEEKYYDIKSGLRQLIALLQSNPIPAVQQTTTTPPLIKLPALDLPTFSGDYQDWSSFYDHFLAIVHNNITLSAAQKLHYL